MAGAINLNPTFCLKSKTSFFIPFRVPTRLQTEFLSKPNPVAVKCRPDDGEETRKLRDELSISELVGTGVDELLNREENRGLLKNLNDATERVERARMELAKIQRQEDEARKMREYIQRMEAYTTEIAECQNDVLKARSMIEEAELLLSINGSSSSKRSTTTEDDDDDDDGETTFDKEKERWESLKAGSISAVVGSLASLPITLAQATAIDPLLLLPLATNFVSCALFGVTYRYVVRRDIDDFQLKTGAALAFGLVKGLSRFGSLELNADSLWSRDIINVGLLVSQDVIMFLLAAVAIDLCFKLDLLSPFTSSRGKPPPP